MRKLLLTLIFLHTAYAVYAQTKSIRVGAKHFNEGYILSEMIAIILEDGGFTVERKFNLGGTAVTFEALRTGAIDVYPEYTGTITAEILKDSKILTELELQTALQQLKLSSSAPYGFNNTYALLVKRNKAASLNLSTISDLAAHQTLRVGLSYEFLERQDGWRNLASDYNLKQQPVGLEHGLAYEAIMENKIDVTDAYSTDGEIEIHDLLLLEDDRNFFPEYKAISFYNEGLPPQAVALLDKMTNLISEKEMQTLNAKALLNKESHYQIAHDFLLEKGIIKIEKNSISNIREIFRKTFIHIQLTFFALLIAVLVAVPTGIFVYQFQFFSKAVLYFTGILQTIPSIALLALMIPLAGIGTLPAVIALFLYALLPILRNTVMGLNTVDPQLKKVASGIGLSEWNKLRLVEIPLAMPMILTGIRTAAVINVGTATLAAFIGAGGLGEFIVTGLALNNTSLILTGAIPAAILAILIELLFEGLELLLIPQHLRQKRF